MKLEVDISEDQLRLLINTIEAVFRFMMPYQSNSLVEFFALEQMDREHFREWLANREKAEAFVKQLQNMLFDFTKEVPDTYRLADMWSVLRHAEWEYQHPNQKSDFWDVRSDKPIQQSDWGLMQIKVKQGS